MRFGLSQLLVNKGKMCGKLSQLAIEESYEMKEIELLECVKMIIPYYLFNFDIAEIPFCLQ
jgi:hypothetical protein